MQVILLDPSNMAYSNIYTCSGSRVKMEFISPYCLKILPQEFDILRKIIITLKNVKIDEHINIGSGAKRNTFFWHFKN